MKNCVKCGLPFETPGIQCTACRNKVLKPKNPTALDEAKLSLALAHQTDMVQEAIMRKNAADLIASVNAQHETSPEVILEQASALMQPVANSEAAK